MSITTVQAAMSGVVLNIFAAATTGTGTPIAIPPSFIHHNFMIKAASGVTSGAVTIEESNDPNDAGTWAIVIPNDSGAVTVANPITVIAGANLLIEHEGRLNFVRARVSTTIAGGGAPSVTVDYLGGKNY